MEWQKIKNKPNYSASDTGIIRNDKTGRILKQLKRTDGYMTVMLGRKTSPLYVHRIVAEAFIENNNNLPQVDHIDGCKSNNTVSNLRWVSVSENCYGFGYKARIENRKKQILAISENEKIVFNSRNECAAYFKCDKSQIEYNKLYVKGNKKGWTFKLVKDIV